MGLEGLKPRQGMKDYAAAAAMGSRQLRKEAKVAAGFGRF
jgi:hypothetical protein